MVTSKQLFDKFGPPEKESAMVLFVHPFNIDTVPKRIYCNKDMVDPLYAALKNVKHRGLEHLIKSWDGCFNIRRKVGASSPSVHSWGYAIDINAAWNRFGQQPTMDLKLVQCFKDAGFDWGGNWSAPDGMHFQLKTCPEVSKGV
jgi:hypothetical protein